MWWRAATTFATIFCKSDQTVLCGGKVSAKFASKSYESARNRTKASLIGRNRKSERKFDIVRKFPNSDGTVQNWREVEQKPDSRVAQIEANDTWYFRFFNFCLISFFCFFVSAWITEALALSTLKTKKQSCIEALKIRWAQRTDVVI